MRYHYLGKIVHENQRGSLEVRSVGAALPYKGAKVDVAYNLAVKDLVLKAINQFPEDCDSVSATLSQLDSRNGDQISLSGLETEFKISPSLKNLLMILTFKDR